MDQDRVFRTGHWVRFSAYEVTDGSIRPATNATLEAYDPWKGWERGVPEKRKKEDSSRPVSYRLPRPYWTLINLVESLQRAKKEEKKHKLIVEWCANHGLLGYKLHECRLLNRPIEASLVSLIWPLPGQRDHQEPVPRTKLNWSERSLEALPVSPIRKGDLFASLMPAPDGIGSDYIFTWDEYDEDVSAFIQEAKRIAASILYLNEMKGKFTGTWFKKLKKKESGNDCWLPEHGELLDYFNSRMALRHLTETISASMELDGDGGYSLCWDNSSLLGTFAIMALFDLTQNTGSALRCPTCSKMFWQTGDHAIYCSETCRKTYNQRVYRVKHPDRNSERQN